MQAGFGGVEVISRTSVGSAAGLGSSTYDLHTAGHLSVLRLVRVAAPVGADHEVGQPLVCHPVHGVLDHAQAVEPTQAILQWQLTGSVLACKMLYTVHLAASARTRHLAQVHCVAAFINNIIQHQLLHRQQNGLPNGLGS